MTNLRVAQGVLVPLLMLAALGCGSRASSSDEAFPDVVAAVATLESDGHWRFEVTISSPYDSAERYADAWRIIGPDDATLGIRELAHDHAGEQPFTRSLAGVSIPDGVSVVTIQGRDQLSGWGGATVSVALKRPG